MKNLKGLKNIFLSLLILNLVIACGNQMKNFTFDNFDKTDNLFIYPPVPPNIEIDDPEKIKAAVEFIKDQSNDWKELVYINGLAYDFRIVYLEGEQELGSLDIGVTT